MNVKIKICGIRNEMEINIMNSLRPDYVGFIFLSKSQRFVAPEYAALLRAKLRNGIEAVGVFYDESLETVAMTAELAGLDAVQLNGNETGEYVSALREYTKCQIIKSFKIRTPMDAERAMSSRADFVMLDGSDKDGVKFDWSFVTHVRRQYFLSGGLNLDNIQQALLLNPVPYAVDVCSGVEANRLKDYRKVMKFIAAVRDFKSIR